MTQKKITKSIENVQTEYLQSEKTEIFPSQHQRKKVKSRKSISQKQIQILSSQLSYESILSNSKLTKQQPIHYARFQLCLLFAKSSELNLADIGKLTRDQIETLIDQGFIQIFDSENGQARCFSISEEATKSLKKLSPRIDLVFATQKTLMGTVYLRNWFRFIKNSLLIQTPFS